MEVNVDLLILFLSRGHQGLGQLLVLWGLAEAAMLPQGGQKGQVAVCPWRGSRLVYQAKGVSVAGFLLRQNMAGLVVVVVEGLEVWAGSVKAYPYEGSQKQPREHDRSKSIKTCDPQPTSRNLEKVNVLPQEQAQDQKHLKEQIFAAAKGRGEVALGEGKLVEPLRMVKEAAPPITKKISKRSPLFREWSSTFKSYRHRTRAMLTGMTNPHRLGQRTWLFSLLPKEGALSHRNDVQLTNLTVALLNKKATKILEKLSKSYHNH